MDFSATTLKWILPFLLLPSIPRSSYAEAVPPPDFTIAFLLLGSLAFWPALAPPHDQITYVSWFDPIRHLVAYFPQVAVGLMFIAGLLMIGKRRPAHQGA